MKNGLKKILIIISIILLFNSTSTVYATDDIDSNENELNNITEEKPNTNDEEEINNDLNLEIPTLSIKKSIVTNKIELSIVHDDLIIKPYIENKTYYLFVPQTIDISNLNINYTGNISTVSNGTLDTENHVINNDFSVNSEITISDNNTEYKIKVLQSNLPSMYITLNGVDLETINNGSKEIKYENNKVQLSSSNSKNNFEDTNVQIKGRGNFNWGMPKKPYQIKLSSKTNVLGMGKSKTWLLIANYGDITLMRNKLVYDLAKDIEMKYTQNSEWIDLWIDGEYQGNYLITEKVQLGSNRVELSDEENALIVELDNIYYGTEDHSFKSSISNTHFVLKDSEADDEGVNAFSDFKDYINNFEEKLYSNNKNWDDIKSMIDVESFIKYYFIQEFSENADGARSSVYMYKNNNEDVLHMGPVWDFDIALGNCSNPTWGGNPNYDYIINIKNFKDISNDWYSELFKIPEFKEEVLRIYNDEIKNKISESIQKVDNHKDILNSSSNMNFIKWKLLGKNSVYGEDKSNKYKDTYEEEVNYLKNWMIERLEYMNKRYSSTSDIIKIKADSHVQSLGWDNNHLKDIDTIGTTGKGLRLEAIKINLDTFNSDVLNNLNVSYQTHVQKIGWQDWVNEGEIAGTTGKGLRLEAIKIKLNSEETKKYTVRYRAHVQSIGWQDWVYEDEIAGTTGKGLRLEALQIEIIKLEPNSISTQSHIQSIGWKGKTYNEVAGTTGLSKRLEAIKISLENQQYPGDIEYRSYISKKGWQEYVKNGQLSGTTGKSLKIEQMQLRLTDQMANNYDLYYRVHVAKIGWLDWAKNDEITGTSGYGYQIEAIEIAIVNKGDTPPSRTPDKANIIFIEK